MFWQIKQQISGMNQQKWWSVLLPSFITKGSMSHMIPYTHAKDCQRISRNMAFLISKVVKYPKVASDGPSWKPKVFLLPARPHPWDRTVVPWGPCASWCPWTPWTGSPAEPWIPWAPAQRVSPKLGWFHLVATLRGKKNKKNAPMAIIGISPHKSQIMSNLPQW